MRARGMDPRVVFLLSVTIGLAVALTGALWALADGSAVAGPKVTQSPVTASEAALNASVTVSGANGARGANGTRGALLAMPPSAESLPPVVLGGVAAANPCAEPAVQAALASEGDDAVIAAFGGGAAFRAAVAAGNAPCINLGDPARDWVVVNKLRPLDPLRFIPSSLSEPAVTVGSAGPVRSDVAAALDRLSSDADAAGVGRIALGSGYRSYDMQISTHDGQVAMYGEAQGEAVSARAGHSEHQTGMAADVVSCTRGCGTIDTFGDSSGGAWVAQNAWQYGFIVRYVADQTPVSGYEPEPWHLRYIGVPLAAAYHDGGFSTLEQFFGLPAAPDYSG